MKSDLSVAKDIRSIRNALWMIVAILLIQLGINLPDLKGDPIAEGIMIFALWAGIFILLFKFVRMLVVQFSHLARVSREEDTSPRE